MGKLKSGVLFLSMEKAVNGTITILLIPVLIRCIGIEQYGLWGILLGVCTYLQYLDLGISLSLERFIAFYEAKQDRATIQRIISTAFTYMLLFCLLLLIIVYTLGVPIMHTLTRGSGGTIGNLLLLAFPALAANIFQSVYMCIPRGLQRFDISSKIQIAGKLLFAGALAVFFARHKDISGLIYAYTLQSIFTCIAYIISVKRLVPELRLFKPGISPDIFSQLFNFGIKIQVSSIAFLVTQHFDKMLLSSYFGLVYAGYYEAATRIIYSIRDIPLFLMSVLIPRISELVSQNNHDKVKEMYQKITQQLAIICFFLMILLLFTHHALLTLLFKTAPTPFTVYVFCILCVTCFWHAISSGATYISRGMGLPSIELKTTIITLLLNCTISVTCMHFFAERGVVLGTAAALFISPFFCYSFVNKLFTLPTCSFIKNTFGNTLLYGCLFIALFIVMLPIITRYVGSVFSALGVVMALSLFTHGYFTLTANHCYREMVGMGIATILRFKPNFRS